jgi:ABC-type branched-subunit amino acid transport system ATPase component/ABC-type branched-subunit amino acid transport system permease subunit
MTEALQLALLGLGTAGIYVILAQGLIVIFRGSGILNLAHAGYALIGAYVFNGLHVTRAWSTAPAFIVSVALVALVGLATDQLVMRRLRGASALARLIATLGVLLILEALSMIIWGQNLIIVGPLLPQTPVSILGTTVTSAQLWLLGIAVVTTAVLGLVWHRTRVGWVTTAVAENQESAAAQGWSPELVSAATWSFGAGLAGVAGILVAPITELSVLSISALITYTLAAALLGGFRSFGLTLLGGLVVGVAQAEVGNYVHVTGAGDAVPFLIIVIVLVFRGSSLPLRGHIFDRLPSVGSGRVRPGVALVGVAIPILLALLITSDNWLGVLTNTFAAAIVFLSVVVLVGYAGQLSLAQYALAGIGALITARLIAAQSWPFVPAAIAGVLGTVVVGLLFALPALRTRGVNLAIVTFGLGVATTSVIFENGSYTGGLSGTTVGRISLFGFSLDPTLHPGRYVAFCGILLVVSMIAVANLRRGPEGRRLLALRSNERAASAAGVSVFAAKMSAFAIAGGIAGLGGIALGFQSNTVTFSQFSFSASISAIAQTVIGGIGFVLGPVFGAVLTPNSVSSVLVDHWASIDEWIPLVAGVGVIGTLIAGQDGAIGQMSKALSRRVSGRLRRPEAPYELGAAQAVRVAGSPLTVRDLSVRYGTVAAVQGVSLEVAPGEVVGVIGPNGAGKTSLMDAITGFTRCTGDVLLGGLSITGLSAHARARGGVSRSFQSLELFDEMTVLENLLVASESREKPWAAATSLVWPGKPSLSPAAVAAVREFDLADCLTRRPADLSYGQRRLVGIARALAAEPSVLLLDEPVAGLDSGESAEFARLVRRVADEWGMGVLVIEHDMSFVMSLCDRIVVLDFGRMIAAGTPDEVRYDPAAVAAYLGTSESPDEPQPAAPPPVAAPADPAPADPAPSKAMR